MKALDALALASASGCGTLGLIGAYEEYVNEKPIMPDGYPEGFLLLLVGITLLVSVSARK